MDVDKFRDDVYAITELLSSRLSENEKPKLNLVRQKLIELYTENLVKINHSVLELICSSELILHGYDVDVEKSVSDILVCDLFATKAGDSTFTVLILPLAQYQYRQNDIAFLGSILKYSDNWYNFDVLINEIISGLQ